jgi:hypothetical protein
VVYFKSVTWNLPAETGMSLKSSKGTADLRAEILNHSPHSRYVQAAHPLLKSGMCGALSPLILNACMEYKPFYNTLNRSL